MAGTINKVILIGRTGDEVKMRYFEGGNSLGTFPLATDEEYTNKAGDKISNTEWHNIVVRNKAAEICEKYLGKGDKIYIEGRIKTRKYQDDKGLERYFTEIHCDEFTFLTPKSESSATGKTTEKSTPKPEQPKSAVSDEDSDDLPF